MHEKQIILHDIVSVFVWQIISVDVASIIAGTKFRGQFEAKMNELIDEATKAKRKVIIFLDELHRLMGAGTISAPYHCTFM